MSSEKIKKIIFGNTKFSYYTTLEWETANPILPKGTIGIDSTKNLIKIGDNYTRWKNLKYVGGGIPIGGLLFHTSTTAPDGYIPPTGALLNRVLYKDLWEFANDSNLIVSDTNWLTNSKLSGFYSTGDNSTTFRTPLLDDIIIEAWTTSSGKNQGRLAGSYQLGTILGAMYINNQFGPSLQLGPHLVAMLDKFSRKGFEPVPGTINKNQFIHKYAEELFDWLHDGSSREANEKLLTYNKQEILTANNLDNTDEDDYKAFYSMPVTSDSTSLTSYNYSYAVGMIRPETIAYPIFIRYE